MIKSIFLLFVLIINVFYSLLFQRFGRDIELTKVIEVIDGDTIIIENGEHVRYVGIDTPETVHPEKPVQCFGSDATQRNRELVLGKVVLLEKDQNDRDEYGRLLRYVYTIEYFINAQLVKEGFAYSYYYPPDLKYYKQIANLEIEALKNSKGLWGLCHASR